MAWFTPKQHFFMKWCSLMLLFGGCAWVSVPRDSGQAYGQSCRSNVHGFKLLEATFTAHFLAHKPKHGGIRGNEQAAKPPKFKNQYPYALTSFKLGISVRLNAKQSFNSPRERGVRSTKCAWT